MLRHSGDSHDPSGCTDGFTLLALFCLAAALAALLVPSRRAVPTPVAMATPQPEAVRS